MDVDSSTVAGRPAAVLYILNAAADKVAPRVLDREYGPERFIFAHLFEMSSHTHVVSHTTPHLSKLWCVGYAKVDALRAEGTLSGDWPTTTSQATTVGIEFLASRGRYS